MRRCRRRPHVDESVRSPDPPGRSSAGQLPAWHPQRVDVEVIEIREFLTQHEPFDRLPGKLLDLYNSLSKRLGTKPAPKKPEKTEKKAPAKKKTKAA